MRRFTLAALVMVVAACARSPRAAPPPAPPAPEQAPPPPPERATFTLVRQGDTVATESFARTPELLDATLTVPNQARLVYSVTLAPDATMRRIEARVLGPAPSDTTPLQRSSAEFRGDSVYAVTFTGDSAQRRATAVPPGTIFYLSPSVALMEQIVRRARAVGGDSVAVPVLLAGTGGRTLMASVVFAPDSARLVLGPAEARLSVDQAGRVLGGAVPSQSVTIARTPAGSTAP